MSRITVCLILALFVGVAHEILGSPLARKGRLARRPYLGIVNGKNAAIKDYPYIGSLHQDSSEFGPEVVGPVIVLNKRWLLTAGVCVAGSPASEFTVRLGSNDFSKGGQVFQVDTYVVPDYYTLDELDWNIAVVKTDKPIQFGSNVKSIKLATNNLSVGTEGKFAGWGSIDEMKYGTHKILQETTLIVSDRTACRHHYGKTLTDRMFCTLHNETGPEGSDYGDPLVFNGQLYGVYSGNDYDYLSNVPLLFVNIATPEVRKWIKNAIFKS